MLKLRQNPNNETEYLKLLIAVGPLGAGGSIEEIIARQGRLAEYYKSYWRPTFGGNTWTKFYRNFLSWRGKNSLQ